MTQSITKSIWERWMREYVPNLIERRKWLKNRSNLKVGDIVMIIEPCTQVGQYPLGRVIETYPAEDGVARVVKVKTSTNEKVRPVIKLCLLEENIE